MTYGTESGIMALAYGGSKSITPDIVETANQTATSVVNSYLNLTKDLDPIPQIVIDATNLIASDFIRKSSTLKEMLENAAVLLETLRGELTNASAAKWANMKYV